MVRRAHLAVFACVLALAACGRGGNNEPMYERVARSNAVPFVPPPDINIASGAAAGGAQQFSYSHSWALILPHAAVSRHFEAARDACLTDKTLDCRLVSANLSSDGDLAQAQLSVLVPHASLGRFEDIIRDPRKGEKADDIRVTSHATHAQSVETAAADSNRKVAQLTGYRDRLAAIAKRPNLSVDDLIKLEAEQARVETDLDQALAEQRGIDSGLTREEVDVMLSEEIPPQPGPLARAFGDAADTLGSSTAAMMIFVIGALPWLPLIAAAVWALVRLVRFAWRRRPLAKPAPG